MEDAQVPVVQLLSLRDQVLHLQCVGGSRQIEKLFQGVPSVHLLDQYPMPMMSFQ